MLDFSSRFRCPPDLSPGPSPKERGASIKIPYLCREMKTQFRLLLLMLVLNLSAAAQIVNIESQRLDTKKEGITGNIDLSYNFTMNTVQLLQLGDRARIGYNKGRHHWLLLTDHSFIKTKDVSIVNLGFEHVRYNYTLNPLFPDLKDSGRISLEVFEQAQFNKIQKINLRFLLGGGIRFHILDRLHYQLNMGTGLMAEYEEMIDYGISRDLLSNNYISFDGQFSEHIGMNTIFYFQPKLIDFGNYRVSTETQIRFKINQHLTYRVIYSLTHDSRDIEEVRKTNYTFRNALSFTF
jgi:putative salt-induced outer membrane protein YdiY